MKTGNNLHKEQTLCGRHESHIDRLNGNPNRPRREQGVPVILQGAKSHQNSTPQHAYTIVRTFSSFALASLKDLPSISVVVVKKMASNPGAAIV